MANKKTDYQALSTELESVMARLQSEDVSVDEAMVAYKRGMELITEMEAYLKSAENKVQKLKTDFSAKS